MKGVILKINPKVLIIDISHEINPFDILEASFLISCAYMYFPDGTVHCIVVDPGVGGDRRPILVVTKTYFFVAPDNGILSYIFQKEVIKEVIHLKENEFFLNDVSQTFHGRDIFAPVSAWLTRDINPRCMGPQIMDYVHLDLPKAKISEDRKRIYGEVIHIDIFGNLVTNISHHLFKNCLNGEGSGFKLMAGQNYVERLCKAYDDLEKGSAGAILSSQGYIELFASQDSLAKKWGIKKGDIVELIFE
jgi:S-adenosylmethionine hydrolase